jgi:hypothetical protein
VEDYEAAPETTGQIRLNTEDEKVKLAEDAFYKLEYERQDLSKQDDAEPLILQLQVCRFPPIV